MIKTSVLIGFFEMAVTRFRVRHLQPCSATSPQQYQAVADSFSSVSTLRIRCVSKLKACLCNGLTVTSSSTKEFFNHCFLSGPPQSIFFRLHRRKPQLFDVGLRSNRWIFHSSVFLRAERALLIAVASSSASTNSVAMMFATASTAPSLCVMCRIRYQVVRGSAPIDEPFLDTILFRRRI